MSDKKQISEVKVLIFEQYSDFIGKIGVFQPMQDWIATARLGAAASNTSTPTSTHMRWDARRVWRFMHNTAPELTSCALALLSLTASEAAVERTFSKQGLVHTKLRNSLSAESVQAQMFIAFNYKALNRIVDADEQGAWVRLAEDIETRPRARGLFLNRLPNQALLALVQEPAAAAAAAAETEAVADGGEASMAAAAQLQDGKEEVADEEEDEEMDEEEEEQKDEVEAEILTHEQQLHNFIVAYVAAGPITTGYRFGPDNAAKLSDALVRAGLTDMGDYVQGKIRQYLRANQPETV